MTFFSRQRIELMAFPSCLLSIAAREESLYDENLESIFINQSFYSKLKSIFYAAKELHNSYEMIIYPSSLNLTLWPESSFRKSDCRN